MKKFGIVLVSAVLAASAGAFADQRISINYSLGNESFTLKDWDSKYESFKPFTIDVDGTWFTSDPVLGPLKVGFDINVGFSLSGSPKVDGVTFDDFLFSGEYLSLGAAFLFDINDTNSVRFTPGVQMTLDQGHYLGNAVSKFEINNLYFALSLNAAYQHYFTDMLGLNAGIDMDIPLAGFFSWSQEVSGRTYSDSQSIGVGFNWHFFAGVALRF